MSDQYIFVWYILVFIVILIIFALREGRDKTRITNFLERKGYRDIKIKRNISTMMHGTVILEVEYRSDSGEWKKNACVIVARPFSENRLFWETPV
jgi:hypothetical protein